jgi:membrane fusion protein (multidrug efflux system)
MTERFSSFELMLLKVPEMAQDQIKDASTAMVAASPNQPSAPNASQGLALPPAASPKPRRTIRSLILPAVILAAVGYGGSKAYDWFVEGRFLVTTDDAYVGAETTIIAAKVAGHVTEVPVVNNAIVRAGDLLVKLDQGDYKLAVDAAKDRIATQDATIQRFGSQMDAQKSVMDQTAAQVEAAKAQLAASQADSERASLEYDRSQKLALTNFGSQQRLEQASADKARTAAVLESARAALTGAQAAQSGAKANLDVLSAQRVEAERVRSELETALAKAEHDLTFTTITAPFDGVVGNKVAVVGQYALPGTRLMALVRKGSAYVEANFKETQLASIRQGQKVDISVDALGAQTIEGVVRSIAPASGSQFSLLPPDNATGNFTKIVQRVAVRIALPEQALKDNLLLPGMSVVASVRTRDEGEPKPTLLGALGLDASATPAASAGK